MTQFKTFTDEERAALKLHHLNTDQPSMLSDSFVLGMRYAATSSMSVIQALRELHDAVRGWPGPDGPSVAKAQEQAEAILNSKEK